jgi:hypothetical protein
MPSPRQVTPADILPLSDYAKIRVERRRQIIETKRDRRIEVGPYATFYFESYDTVWLQIQEMLYIEKGGFEQLQGELDAYNPLIPNGHELVATVMFELDEPVRRKHFLAKLGGIEETAYLSFAGETVMAKPEPDLDRTTAEGKASAVQFVHFIFSSKQIELFSSQDAAVTIGFKHENYAHMTVMLPNVRRALMADFEEARR